MKGKENLIPINKRSAEEAFEIRSRGGKASSEARRRKKTLRTAIEKVLNSRVVHKEDLERIEEYGFDTADGTTQELVVTRIIENIKKVDDLIKVMEFLDGDPGEVKKQVINEDVTASMDLTNAFKQFRSTK